jgi:hypothetical protein
VWGAGVTEKENARRQLSLRLECLLSIVPLLSPRIKGPTTKDASKVTKPKQGTVQKSRHWVTVPGSNPSCVTLSKLLNLCSLHSYSEIPNLKCYKIPNLEYLHGDMRGKFHIWPHVKGHNENVGALAILSKMSSRLCAEGVRNLSDSHFLWILADFDLPN